MKIITNNENKLIVELPETDLLEILKFHLAGRGITLGNSAEIIIQRKAEDSKVWFQAGDDEQDLADYLQYCPNCKQPHAVGQPCFNCLSNSINAFSH